MATPYRIAGCCIDRSPAADLVVAEALRLRSAGTVEQIRLVHVLEKPPPLHAGPFTYREPDAVLRREAQRWLDDRVSGVAEAVGVLLDGHPPDAVCEWAEEAGVGLLLVAPHRGAIDRAIHGEFAGDVVYGAPCPVLIVRPSAPAA